MFWEGCWIGPIPRGHPSRHPLPHVLALEMDWRDLVFASWPVDPALVAAHLPDALAVDTRDGVAWLSIVPFTNARVRPRGLPGALGLDLPELNLRTYVTLDGTSEADATDADDSDTADADRGVYFFSLDAEGILGVLGARMFHHLPYYYARMAHERSASGRTRFLSRRRHPGARPAHFAATYEPTGDALTLDSDSLAAFLTDRYRFYTEAPDGSVRYSDVAHDTWPLYPADVTITENSLFRANGFADPDGEPACHYSPGVDIVALPSRKVDW